MKKFAGIVCLYLVFCQIAYSQELIATDYEKGYVKDGNKFSVWEYYDSNKELELKIDHTTGRLYYLKNDSSDYVIFKNGNWTLQKLRVYPIPLEGYANFYNRLVQSLNYSYAIKNTISRGNVVVVFDVDSLGNTRNYSIAKDLKNHLGSEIVRIMKEMDTRWVQARLNGANLNARFKLNFVFGSLNLSADESTTLAKELKSIVISNSGIRSSYFDWTPGNSESLLFTSSLKMALKKPENFGGLEVRKKGQILPHHFKQLQNLQSLDLTEIELQELPEELVYLKKLRELYADSNYLTTLPSSLRSLSNLQFLSLDKNRFSEFPEEICSLTNLRALDLSNNAILNLESCISQLKSLELIDLSHNNLTSLPEEFYKLSNLKQIYVGGNNLLDETINKLKSSFKEKDMFLPERKISIEIIPGSLLLSSKDSIVYFDEFGVPTYKENAKTYRKNSTLVKGYEKFLLTNDYNINNVKMQSAFSNERDIFVKDGFFQSYHQNGKVKESGQFKNNRRVGLWTKWYTNGKLMEEGVYSDRYSVENFWDSLGNQFVTNKNGNQSIVLNELIEEGIIDNGYRSGKWVGKTKNGILRHEEFYNNGRLTKGVSLDSAGNKFQYDLVTFFPNAYRLGGIVQQNFNFPKEARKEKISGNIYIRIILDKYGYPNEYKIIKGLPHGCNEEAIRLITLYTGNYRTYSRGRIIIPKHVDLILNFPKEKVYEVYYPKLDIIFP